MKDLLNIIPNHIRILELKTAMQGFDVTAMHTAGEDIKGILMKFSKNAMEIMKLWNTRERLFPTLIKMLNGCWNLLDLSLEDRKHTSVIGGVKGLLDYPERNTSVISESCNMKKQQYQMGKEEWEDIIIDMFWQFLWM
jgi:hypothetical protein